MNDIHLSPPLSFGAPGHDLFKVFRGGHMQVADHAMLNSQDVGGAVTAPTWPPAKASPSSPLKAKDSRPSLQAYLLYCKEFLNLDLYPNLPEQDRAVIADFVSGELLQNAQWKFLFPLGVFECVLKTSAGPETDIYTCSEQTVFRINFEAVTCSKETRRLWTPKSKATADESVMQLLLPTRRNNSLELQSPIKQPIKRRTPTRRRSFEERERRNSGSGTSRSRSDTPEPPPAKKATKASSKAASSPKRATPKKTTPKKATPLKKPKKTSVLKKKAQTAAAAASVTDQTWDVLDIIDCKKKYGKYQYLVRWAGLDPEGKPWDDTWEPASNISEDLLRAFWLRYKTKAGEPPAAAAASPSPSPTPNDGKISVQELLNSDPDPVAA